MSAFENVELPMTILGKLSTDERRKRALQLLNSINMNKYILQSSNINRHIIYMPAYLKKNGNITKSVHTF